MRNNSVGGKVKSLADTQVEVRRARAQGKKIVLCHGVFDLIHIGHMHYLEQAADYGDILIVSVVDDKFVKKGPNRPAFSETVRRRSVASLGCVDLVVPCSEVGPYEIISTLKPDVYVRAEDVLPLLDDPNSGLSLDKKILDSIGGKMVFVEMVPLIHSTTLINRYFPANPPEVTAFLDDFKKDFSHQTVVEKLSSLQDLRVLIVGEAIIDEYCWVTPLPGTPSKSPVIAAEFKEKEVFAGGALACANHVSGICRQVDLVSYLGASNSWEDFVRAKLHPNVSPKFFYPQNRSTITKTRYIDPAGFNKFFELYVVDHGYLPIDLEAEIKQYLEAHLGDYDLVIVTDYGHGFISPELASVLSRRANFLAVNTQTNAGNIGFNYITKYSGVDYVCIDEREARLAVHNETSPIDIVAAEIYEAVDADQVIITLGRRGSLYFKDGASNVVPSFAVPVIDTVGAGDAFLAYSSLCAAKGLPSALTAVIGNIAGSLAAGTIGNKTAVDPEKFRRYLKYLLD